jgi:hypothetical protein
MKGYWYRSIDGDNGNMMKMFGGIVCQKYSKGRSRNKNE